MNNKANKTSFKKGHKKVGGIGKGDKMSESAKEKIRKSLLGKVGSLARNWRGGLSDLRRCIPQLNKYKEWRDIIFKRDNYTCRLCGKTGYVEADHIKPLGLIIRENNIKTTADAINCSEVWSLENGRTLCKKCHKETDSYAYKFHKNYAKNCLQSVG